MDQPTCHIDDFGPLPVVRPLSVAELSEVVRRAAAEGQAVYPLGGRTMLDFGLPPSKPGVAVDLRGLDQVIDYPARDMTITVQAGITIAKLQAVLAAEKQQLPVDVPFPDRATIGGALATNASGPRRYSYGTLRDYVIGISAINDEGHEIKAGGRVVKNVAGYDLCKLLVGSLGTLGVITQVTLKLKPVPEAQIVHTVGSSSEAVGPLLDQLHKTQARPMWLELLNRATIKSLSKQAQDFLVKAPWFAIVGFEGNHESLQWQSHRALQEIKDAVHRGMGLHSVGGATKQLWPDFFQEPTLESSQLVFKANLLPSATAAFCCWADTLPHEVQLRAHAGSGIVVGHLPDDLTREQAAAMLTALLDKATAAQGNLVLLRCPPAWKRNLPVWGRPRGDAWLMRRVKQALDPRGVFNPGRFIDGL